MRYSFKWRLINRCNFKCSYCVNRSVVTLYESEEQEYARLLDQAAKISKLISGLSDEYDNASLLLIGGEITLIPVDKMKNIIDTLYTEKLKAIHLTSNFSAPLSWYTDIKTFCNSKGMRFTVVASYHEEMSDFTKFFNKAATLSEEFNKDQQNFAVEFVVTKANCEKLGSKVNNFVTSHKIPCLFDYNRFESWTEKERIYKSNKSLTSSQRTVKCNTEDTFGYTCSNNIYQTTIRPDGKLYGTSCSGSKPYGVLGFTKVINTKEKLCHLHKCSCCGRIRVLRPDQSVFYDVINLDEITQESASD